MGNEVLDRKTCVTFPDNMEMEGKKKGKKKPSNSAPFTSR